MLQTFKTILLSSKNIFLSYCYFYSRRLDFPIKIIPQFFYKRKIDFDELLDKQDVFLLRRSDLPPEETFNELGFLRDDAFVIEPKRISYLSVNLLGGNFQPKHSKYRILNGGAQPWEKDHPYLIIGDQKDFEEVETKCNIYFRANNLHNQQVPYKVSSKVKGISSEAEKYFKKIPPKNENNEFEFFCRTKIQHDPINLNYWHVEYVLIDFKDEPFPRGKENATIKEIANKIYKNILVVNSSDTLTSKPTIDTSSYRYYLK